MKKVILFAVMFLLFVVPLGVNAEETSAGFETVQIGNKSYDLKILSITKNSKGAVEVKTTGSRVGTSVKFWQVGSGNNVFNHFPALGVYIISSGKKINPNRYSIKDVRSNDKEDAIVFEFPTKTMPTKIVFFDVDDETKKITFDAKTKKAQ